MITFDAVHGFFQSSLIGTNHGFGTKKQGDARDTANIPFKKIAKPLQIHGDHIEIVTEFEGGLKTYPNTDGLITKESGIALTVISADCVPIIFVEAIHGWVGISHQGWRGTELKLAQKMVTTMQENQCDLSHFRIAIGPAINECHYPRNLLKENMQQLVDMGFKRKQIDFFPFCTFCDEARFNSYRRSRPHNFGQQFSFVIKSD